MISSSMWAMKIVGKCDCHSDSHVAGSYILEARMIHPIYAPLKYYCNLQYSMRCIFKLIFFCSSSKTKIWSSGISKWGVPIRFSSWDNIHFHYPKGGFQNPWNPPLATPLHRTIPAESPAGTRCYWKQINMAVLYIKTSMSFTLCGESCDCRANTKAAETQFNYSFHHVHNTVVNTISYGAWCVLSMVEIWHVPI